MLCTNGDKRMFEKILVMFILYAAIFSYDGPKLKNKSRQRERIVYGFLMAVTLYLSLIFMFDMNLPTLYELVHSVLKIPAKRIVETFKLPS